MTNILQAFVLALLGNAAIYGGLAFVNEKLFPQLFAGVYEQTNTFIRLMIMLVLCSTLANYLFAIIYRLVDAGYAGMIILSMLIVVLVTKAILIEGTTLGVRVLVATGVLMLAAAWVSHELHRLP